MRWSFETARSIRFGRDVSEELAPLARSFGRRVLLVTGQSPRRFAKRIDAMRDLDLELMQVSVTGEPSLKLRFLRKSCGYDLEGNRCSQFAMNGVPDLGHCPFAG